MKYPELPNLQSVSESYDHDSGHRRVHIKFDDGVDRPVGQLGNTEVVVGRELDPTMDGWLDVAIYSGGDYSEPEFLNVCHPDDPTGAHRAANKHVISTFLDARHGPELRGSGVIGEALARAFESTAENTAKLIEDFEN